MGIVSQQMAAVKPLLLLVLACLLAVPAVAQDRAQQDVQQVLYSLGLQRFFVSAEPMLARELQRYLAADEAESKRVAALRERLAPGALQAALQADLLRSYDAGVYRRAIDSLGREDFVPVIQSCHGEALQDYGPQLQAYQQQLAQQSARPDRVRLAVQLDQAARTTLFANQLRSAIEQTAYAATADVQSRTGVPWPEVDAERAAALREAAQAWYLYCGRFFRDDVLQALVDNYQDPAVQQVLDQYAAALARVLDDATREAGAR
jgi:hypothetical protein